MSYRIATLKRAVKGKNFKLQSGTKVYVVQSNVNGALVRLKPEDKIEYPVGNSVLDYSMTELATFYERKDQLFGDILTAIRNNIGRRKMVEFGENGFEDDAGNDLVSVDKNNVYFEGGSECYELGGLSLLDALNVYQTITNQPTTI